MEEIAAQEQLEEASQAAARGEDAPQVGAGRRLILLRYLRYLRNLRPQTGVALVLWRVETATVTPLALLLIVTLGRWPAALAMGSLMAVFAAAFLFLLDDDPVLDDARTWAGRRRLGRVLERLAARDDLQGKAQRALSLIPAVMVVGPFWRAVTFHLFRMRRPWAYLLSVGGSIPHSLLWTGLVLGGIWEGLVWPWLKGL